MKRKLFFTIVLISAAVMTHGQYKVPLYVPGNTGGKLTDSNYSVLFVAGQNAIGETTGSGYKAYLGLLAAVNHVYTGTASVETGNIRLWQNYPNPFSHVTTIPFETRFATKVRLVLYDILGKPVQEILNENRPPGKQEVVFNAENIKPGLYLYQLQTKNFQQTKTMVLTK